MISAKWMKSGRTELLQFFTAIVYGEIPGELNISSREKRNSFQSDAGGKSTNAKYSGLPHSNRRTRCY